MILAPWPDVAPSPEAEAKFVERLVARDERAFNELVLTYEGRIHALVVRVMGNSVGSQAEAEEITQEVFIQVFKAVGSFRGDAKLSTWMYRIAVNLCKNRAKYLKSRHTGQQDVFEDMAERAAPQEARGTTSAHVERPDEMVAGRQVEVIVRDAIAKLDPSFRECLVLRDVEELSYEEIEAITGLAAGTVKSRIHRARGQLRELVEAELGEKVR
jgi:RNA polymerase sigma-70 factor (ECF subfamily)